MLHIVTSKWMDLDGMAHGIAAGERPGHVLLDLAALVPARFRMPTEAPAMTAADRMRGRLFSRPELWAFAREVVRDTGPDDTLFCTGEDIGLPLAAACHARANPPRLIVTVHNLNRPRGRMALRLFPAGEAVSLWLTPAQAQAEFLTNLGGIAPEKIRVIPEQTDTHFYTPPPSPAHAAPSPARPIIASVGLEQRDYGTLAAAAGDLLVDVRISGYSTDARALRHAFPEPLPPNMTRQFYEWPELVKLYQSADLVVVPLFPNRYAAGITTFLEALACGRPVIVTRTEGLASYCDIPGICLSVPPGNPRALATAIRHLLASPPTARQLAWQGRQWLLAGHTPRHWLDAVLEVLNVRRELAHA